MRKENYYWIKSTGEVIEVDRDKFLELDRQNAMNTNKHQLVWKTENSVSFIEIGNWVSIDVLKKIID